MAYFGVPTLLVLVFLWAVYIQFPSGWNFVFPFLLLRLLFFLKIGGHFRQKCVFFRLPVSSMAGTGALLERRKFPLCLQEGIGFLWMSH